MPTHHLSQTLQKWEFCALGMIFLIYWTYIWWSSLVSCLVSQSGLRRKNWYMQEDFRGVKLVSLHWNGSRVSSLIKEIYSLHVMVLYSYIVWELFISSFVVKFGFSSPLFLWSFLYNLWVFYFFWFVTLASVITILKPLI